MKVINYFDSDRKAHWLAQIGSSDWAAGRFLYELLKDDKLQGFVGHDPKVLLLVEGDELISFCTYSEKDEITSTDLTPWIGFVYTFPQRRGHHYIGRLFDEIAYIAKSENVSQAYISTDHVGLYEKYGCEFYRMMTDAEGNLSRVYIKRFDRGRSSR
ncbi:MAG: GNAT family N-acetyltransferase [Oscillospiraceae bacterium]